MKASIAYTQIDIVLNFFDANNRNNGVHNADIMNGLEKLNTNINKYLLREILVKLVSEGYIRIEKGEVITPNGAIPDIDFYLLTFEGELLQATGGYNEKIRLIAKNESRKLKNDHRLIWGTWFAGIAAILLLIWQFFLWINPVYVSFPYVLFGIVRK